MVQAWVGHFVTPITIPYGYSLVLVYIWRVTTTRRDQNTQHKDLKNTITMVVEPPTPQAVWIWWTHAAWGVGGLAHGFSKDAIEAI